MRHRLTVIALLAAVLTGVTGCGSEQPAQVKERGDDSSVVTEGDGSDETTADDAEEADSKQAASAVLGDTVTVGDWDVKITQVAMNANQAIHKANMFNDKPKAQYILVSYEATYTGAERIGDVSDLTWSLTTTDNKVNDPSTEVTPADNQEWPTEARNGGTVKGQILFDLTPATVKGGILTVEGYTEDFDTVYADFKI